MDADGYHIAKNIIELAVAYLQEPGLVLGVRAKKEVRGEHQRHLIRHLLTRFGNYYVRLWLPTGINDNTTGFRMLSRELIDVVSNSSIMSRGFSFQAEVVHLARIKGFNIKEVEMQFGARLSGRSKLSSRIFFESLLLPPLLKIKLLWKLLSRQIT
jgi:dolichol-phosphate mannosyltransferase